jgi:hypothetical protein
MKFLYMSLNIQSFYVFPDERFVEEISALERKAMCQTFIIFKIFHAFTITSKRRNLRLFSKRSKSVSSLFLRLKIHLDTQPESTN